MSRHERNAQRECVYKVLVETKVETDCLFFSDITSCQMTVTPVILALFQICVQYFLLVAAI